MAEANDTKPAPQARSMLIELTRVRVLLFLREPEAIFWVIVFPLILAIVLGFAFQSRGPATEIVGVFAGDRETAEAWIAARVEAEDLPIDWRVESDRASAEGDLRMGRLAALVELSDDADGIDLRFVPERPEAEIARLRIESLLSRDSDAQLESSRQNDRQDNGPSLSQRRKLAVRRVEEDGTRYIDWLFPGILGMNLMGTGIWGIGFAIADMRQKKLLRRLLVTPMRRSSLLASFVLSRGVFLGFELSILLTFAFLVLGVPNYGPVASLGLMCLLGTTAFAALGLLVASRARTIEGVSGLMNFVMLPMWLCSGVFFSYEKFPEVLHPAIRALPLTAVNDGLRAVMLEGQAFPTLEAVVLVAWSIVGFGTALKFFRWE